MNIGIVIGRIGGVDGVALETEKWIEVLRRMGHEVFLIAGEFEKNILDEANQTYLPILSFFSRKCHWEQKKAFFKPDNDPAPLLEVLEKDSDYVAKRLLAWFKNNKIDLFISQNASALPCHITMGIGIKKAVTASGIKTIAHDHDFAWERRKRYDTPHQEVREVIKSTFPLLLPHVKHAVINSKAQAQLKEGFGQEAIVVPNVMDFNIPYGRCSKHNSTLLKDLGVQNGDIPLLQATRVVRRKRIEVAFELIQKLEDKRIKLIVTGSNRDDEGGRYFDYLTDDLELRRIDDQVIFGSELIRNRRGNTPDGNKLYSLSDAYAKTIACTYFTEYEGFGNAFVEAVLAKKPIFVNNYKPVYWPEIGSKGFRAVMIENCILNDKAIAEMTKIIFDKKLQKDIGEHNFELGKKHFSFEVLEKKLEELLAF